MALRPRPSLVCDSKQEGLAIQEAEKRIIAEQARRGICTAYEAGIFFDGATETAILLSDEANRFVHWISKEFKIAESESR